MNLHKFPRLRGSESKKALHRHAKEWPNQTNIRVEIATVSTCATKYATSHYSYSMGNIATNLHD